MRYLLRSILAIVLIIGTIVVMQNSLERNEKKNNSITQSSKSEDMKKIEPFSGEIHQSVFVPYWNIPTLLSNSDEHDTVIYFGVSPDAKGNIIHDSGFSNIGLFLKNTSADKERLLTVRMFNTENNQTILDEPDIQKKIIDETIQLTIDNNFDGIVLDLEMGVIPFDDTKDKITSFIKRFSEVAHNGIIPLLRDNPDNTKALTFSLTIYGDTFYRARPYDVEKLAYAVDEVYVMAYDFHKSRGEPGPNFPFSDKQKYGYDFQKMISDFTKVVPREKLTILFGMYGYDWTLGAQGKPLKTATAIPLNEIDSEGAVVDSRSKEKYVTYIDDDGFDHILWFEDKESVAVKIEYLKSQGIGKVGYWVWGYF